MKRFLVFWFFIAPFSLVHAQNSSEDTVVDSLRFKRSVFSGAIYQDQQRLRPRMVRQLFQEDTLSRRQYRLGRLLRPIGPLASVAGIGLGYIALKGAPAVATISYENQDITVDYIIRDRTKLIGGLGLFLGGFLLVEASNELVAQSVKRFNKRLKTRENGSKQASFHLGITPIGHMALCIRF